MKIVANNFVLDYTYIYIYIYIRARTHTHTHTHRYLDKYFFRYNWKFIAFLDCTLRVTLLLLLLCLLLLLFCSHFFFGLNSLLISGINPLFRTLVRKYKEGKGAVADSVFGLTTLAKAFCFLFDFPKREIEREWERESGCCYERFRTEVDFLDVMSQLRKVEFTFTSQGMRHMQRRKRLLLWKLYFLTPATAKMDLKYVLWKDEFLFWLLGRIESGRAPGSP